jgi:N-methylhydantoinase A
MMAFGGSGPVHAARIARILGIREVILPMGAGVMSAVGLLVSPLSFETVRSKPVLVSEISEEDFTAGFAPLVSEASAFLHEAGVAEQDVFIRRRLDMRYQGQGYEIEVVLPDTPERKIPKSAVTALFQDAYERIFTTIFDPAQAEIVNWKVEAVGPSPESGGAFHLVEAAAAADARKGTRRAYFPELDGYVDCPVYDRYALAPESTIQGPALIEERESTCVIGAKDVVRVDAQHNLIIELTELDA